MTKRWLCFLVLVFLLPACQNQNGSKEQSVFNDPDKYVQYGNSYLRKENPNFERAMKQFRHALEIDPNHYEALIGLGDAAAFRARTLEETRSSGDEKSNSGENKDEERTNGATGQGGDENRSDIPRMEQRNRRRDLEEQVDERIDKLVKQSALAYAKAKSNREDAATPFFKYGRLIYQFRHRSPQSVEKAKKSLKKALKLAPEDEKPLLRAKILFYLGATTLYLEGLKSGEKRDYGEVKSYFNKYLSLFHKRDKKPPRRAEIERLLMDIEDYEEEQNESSSDS